MLVANDRGVANVNRQFADVAGYLADDREDLADAIANLGDALAVLDDFIKDNRGNLQTSVDNLLGPTQVAGQAEEVARRDGAAHPAGCCRTSSTPTTRRPTRSTAAATSTRSRCGARTGSARRRPSKAPPVLLPGAGGRPMSAPADSPSPRLRRLLALGWAAVCLSNGVYDTPLPGGADLGSHPMKITADFDDVLDLVPQSSVKVDNVAVGRVATISLNPDGAAPGSPCWSTATSPCRPAPPPGSSRPRCWVRSTSRWCVPTKAVPGRALDRPARQLGLADTSPGRPGRAGPRRPVAGAQRWRHRPVPGDLPRAAAGLRPAAPRRSRASWTRWRPS